MVKADLERWIEQGKSLEEIARLVGRHPSTVGYWVAKHGLRAAHHERHAPRGGLSREVLEPLIETGASTRTIAGELGISQATVNHWLRKLGLETLRAARNRELRRALATEPGEPEAVCPRHGLTRHVRVSGRGLRCAACRGEAVGTRRRRMKRLLVDEAGGRCVLCGYDRYLGALHFHHVDPKTKDFHLAHRGVSRALARARNEVSKCVLQCSNCRAEVEGGIVRLPG
jgi:transposase-like protein